jgi:hypothetical protein
VAGRLLEQGPKICHVDLEIITGVNFACHRRVS